MGSHDSALDLVIGELAERGFTARSVAIGSLGGVAAVERGECDLAPVHLIDPRSGGLGSIMVVKRQQELLKRVRAPESVPGLLQFAARKTV
jgi:molybdate-binding protein